MIKELFKNQRALILVGLVHFLLFVILAVISQFDVQTILGIDRWIKPMKFAISIAIYLWTLAIFLNFVRGWKRTKSVIVYGSIVMMLGEIILITMQSIRGTTSHFNISTPFDSIVFNVMGVMIAISTLLSGLLLYLYLKAEIDLPKSIIWGVRLGIILLIAAGAEGALMAGLMRHSIGTMDGGAGLPLVNWSTVAGDLRVAHFVGMHAFQAIPFFAYTLEKYEINSSVRWTIIFAAAYFTIFTFVFVQALFGKPLFSGF